VHVSRLLALAASRRSSGRRLPLPGGREAIVEFDALRIGPRRSPAAPFTLPLDVPGRAQAPGGTSVLARAAQGPVKSGRDQAVVAVDERARLVLRTRQPGDRVYEGGRRVSLKKFLIEQRVPVSARPGLPLVASGHDVVFVPGLMVDSPPGERFVSLEVGG
jgi:tRNA(Ile)-lysidine synthase